MLQMPSNNNNKIGYKTRFDSSPKLSSQKE